MCFSSCHRLARARFLHGAVFAVSFFPVSASAQQPPVTAQVEIVRTPAAKAEKTSSTKNHSDVVVWLKPLDPAVLSAAATQTAKKRPQLIQRNKSFEPHVLVVRVGSVVDFPNRDPFFHNVFSLFDGKRFDLGLYEAGATNSAHFDRVGISFLFCNIHPEMSAVIVVVDTPYFAVSDRSGRVAIPDVPDGRYEMHVWYERGQPEDLKSFTRTITISSGSRSLGAIPIRENSNFSTAHKNKYGQDYVPPPHTTYSHP
jgi:plastocyanin